MKQYVYKIVEAFHLSGRGKMEQIINEEARDGWRVACIYTDGASGKHEIILEKETKEK